VDKSKLAEFLAQHPTLVALAFAGLIGMAGLNTFRAGMTYAELRRAVAEAAFEASEALGG
jgi:hypothetical protein